MSCVRPTLNWSSITSGDLQLPSATPRGKSNLKKEVEELCRKSTKRERSQSSAGDSKRSRAKTKEEEAEQAKAESTATSKPKAKPKEEDEYTYEYETEDDEDTKVPVKTEGKDFKEPKAWVGGSGNYGMLKESKAKGNNPASLNFLGGMRNPTEIVAGMPGSLNLFVRQNPLALETAATYSTADCRMDRPTVDRWRAELSKLVGNSSQDGGTGTDPHWMRTSSEHGPGSLETPTRTLQTGWRRAPHGASTLTSSRRVSFPLLTKRLSRRS